MKVRETGYRRKLSIADAVESECQGFSDHGAGVLEDVGRLASNSARMIGRLMEKLHVLGVLSNQDVIDLLGKHTWEEAE